MTEEPFTILEGDCIKVLKTLPAQSIDVVCTDPPYAVELWREKWDKFTAVQFQVWCEKWATAAKRVLKPKSYLFAFSAARTYHRLASGIEDAGFEIQDLMPWMYASGLPKSEPFLRPAHEPICFARLGTASRPLNVRQLQGEEGRWPTNVMLDEEVAALLPNGTPPFFYCPKPTVGEKEEGLEGLPLKTGRDGTGAFFNGARAERPRRNTVPTIKPIDLMRRIVRLSTKPGDTVLDPFVGSGTTGVACVLEGRRFIGIEQKPEHAEIARRRIAHWYSKK